MYEKHDEFYPPPHQRRSLTGSSRRNGRRFILFFVFFLLCFISVDTRGQGSIKDPFSGCRGNSADTEDPLYGCQWHLKNTGQFIYSGKEITAGEDINAEGVWNDGVYGSGINVAIVSDGMDLSHEDLSHEDLSHEDLSHEDLSHEDLSANVRSGLNYDLSGKNSSEENSSESVDLSDGSSFTGTRAAGVIAATGYNGSGARGVAPGANVCSYRLSGDPGEADAMVRNNEITAVSVSDRGREDGVFLQSASAEWEEGVEEGVEEGIREGFYGRGIFYVRGAGDGHESGDQANFSEYSSYYGVTAVCSTDGFGKKSIFSEEGVNLWVCAPGSDIVTTDNNDDYVVTSGTFLSAAQVAGVAALLREINGQLSWRDIKLILAGSARQNDVSDPSWETGAVKYGSDVERYNYSPRYGFGVVDAEAAAELAGSWKGVGEMRTVTASSDNELTIPDGEGEADGVLVSTLMISDLEEIFTEFVEVELVLSCDCLQDLNIRITSPSGTVSELVREFSGEEEDAEISYVRRTHRFGSAKHLGEDPSGEWTLDISDTASGDEADEENTFTLHSWSIKVYGHGKGDIFTSLGSETGPKHHDLTFSGATIPNQVYTEGVQITPLDLPPLTGGSGRRSYRVIPTVLPRGLSISIPRWRMTGTPMEALEETEYTIRATDLETNDVADIEFRIRIRAAADVPDFGDTQVRDQTFGNGRPIRLGMPVADGGNGNLNYSITPALPAGLTFTSNNRQISGTLNVAPNMLPLTETYTYKVTDSDSDTDDGDSDTLTFSYTIEANSVPSFSETIPDQTYVQGTSANLPVTLPEATGGNGTVSYSLTPVRLPAGLDFDENTRVISGTPTETIAAPGRTYTYRAMDDDLDTGTRTFSITITALSFDGQVSSPVLYLAERPVTPLTLPAATGGTAPYTYSLTPAPPAGLTFDRTTRVISGTPTAATPLKTYTYTVTDGNGTAVEVMFDLAVRAHFSGVEIQGKVYTVGTAVMETLPEATGHNGTVTYSLTPVLSSIGLSFDPATRVISGTPTATQNARTYTYTATTGAGGPARTLMFHITVRNEPNTIPSFGGEMIEDKEYIAGIPITPFVLPEATGGNGNLTYSLTPGLPDGLDFNETTRTISGTPTAATSETDHTWSAADEDNEMEGLTFSITVEEDSRPEFGSDMIEVHVYSGSPIRLPAATGGNAPLRYSIMPPLPPELRLNETTGRISGTPRSASTRTYMYTVTDRNGDTDDVSFMLSVTVPPPTSGNGGGGGGCAVSDQSSAASDIFGAVACLMLIPVSVVIRRKRRSRINA